MFYLLFKNKWVEHQIDYLSSENDRARLDPTLPGKSGKAFMSHRAQPLESAYRDLYLADIMSKNLVSVDQKTSLQDCYKLLIKKQIHHLIIENEGVFVGVISDRDLMAYTKVPFAAEQSVQTVMTNVVLAAHESVTVGRAALVLNKEKISSLPVLSDDCKIIGLVTLRDMASVLSGLIL